MNQIIICKLIKEAILQKVVEIFSLLLSLVSFLWSISIFYL